MIERPVMLLPDPDSPFHAGHAPRHHVEGDVIDGFDDAVLVKNCVSG